MNARVRARRGFLPLATVFAVAVAAAFTPARAADVLPGTATFRERMALPPDAVFEAVVEDVTRTDFPPELIGRVRIEPVQNVPIAFSIPYDPRLVLPGHRYLIHARIIARDRILFATPSPEPVLVGGQWSPVQLLLERSAGIASETPLGTAHIGSRFAGSPPIPSVDGTRPVPLGPPTAHPTSPGTPGEAVPAPGPIGALPASFSGVLPCADCAGIRHDLELAADGTFDLTVRYLGRVGEPGYTDEGRWSLGPNGNTLTLTGWHRPLAFAVKSPSTLRLLDAGGREIVSNLNYDLTRTDNGVPMALAPSVGQVPPPGQTAPGYLLRGMYRQMGGEGVFVECGGVGRPLPIAERGDAHRLERAYLREARQPAEEVLVEVQGRIAMQAPSDGGRLGQALEVSRFIGVRPGETCGQIERVQEAAATPAVELRNTYWKLTRLGSQPAEAAGGQEEPHLMLNPDIAHFSGNGGCNGLGGEFFLDGNYLTFQLGPTTMMACETGMEQEAAFKQALTKAEHWSIAGRQLQLYDAEGNPLARFEAGFRE